MEAYVGPQETRRFKIGDRVRYSAGMVTTLGRRYDRERGTVVGFGTFKTDAGEPFPEVLWDSDPQSERACEDSRRDIRCSERPGTCQNHPIVPYLARMVSPRAIRRAS